MDNSVHQISILVGNGFDLGLNMPTNWIDFKNWLSDNNKIQSNSLVIYLSSEPEQNKFWSDVEAKLPDYLEQTTGEKAMQDLDEFSELFEQYLTQLDEFMLNIVDSPRNIEDFNLGLLNLLKKVPEIDNPYEDDIEITFINFNYTTSLDKILKASIGVDIDGNYAFSDHHNWILNTYDSNNDEYSFHVHGFLEDLNSQVCIGIDSEKQLFVNNQNDNISETEEYRDVRTRFIKQEMVSLSLEGNIRYKQAQNIISKSDSIIIYGLSLGRSDKIWIDEIVRRISKGLFNMMGNAINPVFVAFEDGSAFKKQTTKKIKMIRTINEKFQNDEFNSNEILIHVTTDVWQFIDCYEI